jgi:hypothetical protein
MSDIQYDQSQDYLQHTWRNVTTRCHNPNTVLFYYYGGRGIDVCPQWRNDAEAFIRDILSLIGPRPSEDHSIDRKDNNRGYYPDNVRWATFSEQAQNRRPKIDRLPIEIAKTLNQAKTPKLLRLTPDTVRRLKEAAALAGMSEAVYTELALKAQFKKDGAPSDKIADSANLIFR